MGAMCHVPKGVLLTLKSKKNRYWGFIIYPDSLPVDWKDILSSTGLPIAISPLHKDKNPDGSIKKLHYHVLACWDGPTTYKCAYEVSQLVNGSCPVPVLSVRGMYRYHLHLDNPEKVQYRDEDRLLLGGFDISNYTNLTDSECAIIENAIRSMILTEKIYDYASLIDRLASYDLTMCRYASTHTLFFDRYLSGVRLRNKIKAEKIIAKKDNQCDII